MRGLWQNKKDLIKYLISDKEKIIDGENKILHKCVAHSFTKWQELWTVWKVFHNGNRKKTILKLFIIKPTESHFYTFKAYSESHFNNFYGCPKKYLKITNNENKMWRRQLLEKFKTPF
jgi:hypothetical protein